MIMKNHILLVLFVLTDFYLHSQTIFDSTSVVFRTSDKALQSVFDKAEGKAKWNIKNFGKYKVLVEGAGYDCVWLETQPMGVVMYAKRDIEIFYNGNTHFLSITPNTAYHYQGKFIKTKSIEFCDVLQ